jgi:acyl carrier protein
MSQQEVQARGPQEIQAWVIEACCELGLRVEGGESDFFAIGGTSMTAMRLIAAAEHEFGEDSLPAEDLYERSALRDIAASIASHTAVAAPSVA